ncbi:centrosomal protein of 57 kDa isoform X2 [Takifugu flavidus]|uniref:centrosomal protein of 57 kDa isoform X2 n=1 Tax=Takifugu flavidus TaxID=433684 RepID=UPI002544200E|nr:centrosomal protein of 57 kDa isoform X2 [Takifugu flavidus]
METLSKTHTADAKRERGHCPAAARATVPDSHSSYKEYPVHRPLIHTLVHHTPETRTHHPCRSSSPSKAIPETSSEAILSALRNLQEKIRKLEREKWQAELNLHSIRRDVSHAHLQSDKVTQTPLNDPTDMEQETSGWPNCNQVLITNLAAAESRCAKLERQLDVMRRLLASQGSKETTKAADGQSKVVPEPAQSEKVKRLEQDYHRLTRTQSYNEMKIRQLEMKLQEEEHQRKLVQDKTSQLQSDLEANRILLQSVSPHLARRRSKEKPHPVSAGCSHSVRANVQSVLSLLKRHQPHLCNRRVLSTEAKNQETGSHKRSDAPSPSSPSAAGEEELSELLRALQEEMRLMSLEQDELMRQQEASVSEEERRGVQREQERLLVKMEHKGEQISKLYTHVTQMKKLRKEACSRVNSSMPTRGRSAGAVGGKPGEKSKRNLELLRDMKALRMSLQT